MVGHLVRDEALGFLEKLTEDPKENFVTEESNQYAVFARTHFKKHISNWSEGYDTKRMRRRTLRVRRCAT